MYSILIFKIILLQTIESISAQSYREQFKNVCGHQNIIGRIVGGSKAALGEFPFMARIGVKYEIAQFFCGGSLITDSHVLTAEHCFYHVGEQTLLNLLVVSLGDHTNKGTKSCVGRRCSDRPIIYKVAQLIPYDLDANKFVNDITILKLQKKVKFTRWISPICLPNNSTLPLLVGDVLTTIGFGLVNSQDERSAEFLQKVQVPIKPNKDCELHSEPLGEGQICAGSDTQDSCDGDSGGPLFKIIATDIGPRYYQIGIVSYGPEHCGGEEPGVYESVLHFLPWIDRNLDSFH